MILDEAEENDFRRGSGRATKGDDPHQVWAVSEESWTGIALK